MTQTNGNVPTHENNEVPKKEGEALSVAGNISDKNYDSGIGDVKKGDPIIPVLRTYEHDVHFVKKTKGGADLRAMIAKEKDEKRKAKDVYLRQTKDLLKDSLVLKDKRRSFLNQQKGEVPEKEEPDAVDTKYITEAIAGAAEYMKEGVASGGTDTDEPAVREPVPEKPSGGAEAATLGASASSEVCPAIQKKELGAFTVQTSTPDTDTVRQNSGILSRIQGVFKPKDTLTETQQKILREKQREAVEKEILRNAWKDFEVKREKLHQMGLEARDIRSYGVDAPVSRPVRYQNVFAILIVLVLLAGLIITVISIAIRSFDQPGVVSLNELRSVPDVIASEERVFVNTGALSDDWGHISQPSETLRVFTKFVPYRTVGEESVQIDLSGFSRLFSVQFPDKLLTSFGSYYFTGNYTTDSGAQGMFIVSVENYGDALVRMLDWEENVINALVSVFPGMLEPSNSNNTVVQRQVVDNKDVRILRNGDGVSMVRYYFFNRGILVFTVGDEDIIPVINDRIRSSNAL